MREEFEKWRENRGVWPRAFHDEVFEAGWQAATALQAEEIERLTQCLAKANGHDDHVVDALKYGTGFMQGVKRADPKDVYPQAERVRELE